MRWLFAALFVAFTAAAVYLFWPAPDSWSAEPPRLVVLVVIDQLRGDYLKRWEELYGEGGFKRLMKDGAWFTDCHYPYANTLTAAGHASIATGCSPDKHGIIANDWYCRAEAATVSCVGPPPNQLRQGEGPYRRRQESFADSLMGVSPKSKVVSLSIKDRVAILLAALRAQVCYWFDLNRGDFVTSPYYRDTPHDWVKKFNAERRADPWLGKSWQRFRPELDYDKHSGPDDFPFEGTGYEQGQTFPHRFVKGKDLKNPTFYGAIANSPVGNEMVLELAKRAIDAEQLGQRDVTDLLCIGLSSNDLVGHAWGPDSHEVLDITLRTDVLMKELLDYLDAKVGKDRYVIGLSADHGVCPIPEFAAKQGKKAGRVVPELLTSQSEAFLNQRFLKPGEKAAWLEMPKRANAWVYLNKATIKELGLTEAAVETALADWLTTQPGVQVAYTRTELQRAAGLDPAEGQSAGSSPAARNPEKERHPFFDMTRRSFHPDESGDVHVVLKPYHMFSPPLTSAKSAGYRTTHGTPHPYDTHVPLIVMGPGIQSGIRTERVTPQAMASILSRAMGVPPPRGAEAPVPERLFR